MGFLNDLGDAMSGRVAFGAGLRELLRHFTDANTVIAIWWQDFHTRFFLGGRFKGTAVSLPTINFQLLC